MTNTIPDDRTPEFAGAFSQIDNPLAQQYAGDVAAYLMGRELLDSTDRDDCHRSSAAAHEAGHAVIIAAYGHAPASIRVFTTKVKARAGQWGGEVRPALADPLIGRINFADLAATVQWMCVIACGYMGERAFYRESVMGGAHEMGVVLYLCKILETHHGINRTAALRATLSECDRIINDNRAIGERIAARLMEQTTIDAAEAAELLADTKPATAQDWLTAANNNPPAYPEVEQMLRIADAFAELAVGGIRMIADALKRHKRAALLFSGGKDSIVLAHMLKDYRASIELIWVNTGAMFPHMVEFVRSYGQTYKLTELASNQPQRLQTVGLPARIVPIFNTPLGQRAERDPRARQMITDWPSCCGDLRGKPIQEYMERNGITLLIHGQRHSDNTLPGVSQYAAETMAPIWDWSDAQVMGYIEAHKIQLPEQYPEYGDSGECWNCTADFKPGRFNFMRRRYPELLAQLRPMLDAVHLSVVDQFNKIRPELINATSGDQAEQLKHGDKNELTR